MPHPSGSNLRVDHGKPSRARLEITAASTRPRGHQKYRGKAVVTCRLSIKSRVLGTNPRIAAGTVRMPEFLSIQPITFGYADGHISLDWRPLDRHGRDRLSDWLACQGRV